MQQLHISYYTGYYKIFYVMPEMYMNNIHTHTLISFKIKRLCQMENFSVSIVEYNGTSAL